MGRPTHVVFTGQGCPFLTLGRVYKVTSHDSEGRPTIRDDQGEPSGTLGYHRPATPEEVALGHCSHVVDTVFGGIFPARWSGGAAVFRPGSWRPATLKEIARDAKRVRSAAPREDAR